MKVRELRLIRKEFFKFPKKENKKFEIYAYLVGLFEGDGFSITKKVNI